MTYSLIGAIREACRHVASNHPDRARAVIDEALVLIDVALLKRSRRGRPKTTLRTIRGHVEEAGLAVMKADLTFAAASLDEAMRAIAKPTREGELAARTPKTRSKNGEWPADEIARFETLADMKYDETKPLEARVKAANELKCLIDQLPRERYEG